MTTEKMYRASKDHLSFSCRGKRGTDTDHSHDAWNLFSYYFRHLFPKISQQCALKNDMQ